MKKILSLILLTLFLIFPENLYSKIKNSKISYANTDHVVDTEILFDEIYNIDISGGHFDATAEIMLSWDGDITAFTKKFGNKTIHGEKMEKFLKTVWYPEFLIANSTASRTTFYRTLSVENGKFELFEKFGSRLTIDAEMPRYPFGNLDLYMEISAYSGNIDQMLFKPGKIKIGHKDSDGHGHVVIKGNWSYVKSASEAQNRSSLNHGGKEKFSYLISHVQVVHDYWDSVQKIIFPVTAIIILSMLINFYFPLERDRATTAYWRFYGNWALFFAVPAYKFALQGEIPTTHYIGLIDFLFIFSLFIVTANLILAFTSHYYFIYDNPKKAIATENFIRKRFPFFALIFFVGLLFLISRH